MTISTFASAASCLELLARDDLPDFEFDRLLRSLRDIAGDAEDAAVDLSRAITDLKSNREALAGSTPDEAGEIQQEMQDTQSEISRNLMRLRKLVGS